MIRTGGLAPLNERFDLVLIAVLGRGFHDQLDHDGLTVVLFERLERTFLGTEDGFFELRELLGRIVLLRRRQRDRVETLKFDTVLPVVV